MNDHLEVIWSGSRVRGGDTSGTFSFLGDGMKQRYADQATKHAPVHKRNDQQFLTAKDISQSKGEPGYFAGRGSDLNQRYLKKCACGRILPQSRDTKGKCWQCIEAQRPILSTGRRRKRAA